MAKTQFTLSDRMQQNCRIALGATNWTSDDSRLPLSMEDLNSERVQITDFLSASVVENPIQTANAMRLDRRIMLGRSMYIGRNRHHWNSKLQLVWKLINIF